MKQFISWRHPARLLPFRRDDRMLLIVMGIIVGISSGLAALGLNISLVFMLETLHHWRHHWWAFLLPAA
jgi:CIC family chloride channel protein